MNGATPTNAEIFRRLGVELPALPIPETAVEYIFDMSVVGKHFPRAINKAAGRFPGPHFTPILTFSSAALGVLGVEHDPAYRYVRAA